MVRRTLAAIQCFTARKGGGAAAPPDMARRFRGQPVRNFGLALTLIALLGVSAARPAVGSAQAPQQCPARGILFVADGSGDFRTLSCNLAQAVGEARLPLAVETVVWSHGYGRYVIDHVDHCNHLEMGRQLAERVLAYRRSYPWLRIYLAGHSAGNAVVLAAAERLPPDTVDRIILLAPSVSPGYDLRPALASSREGIDAFISDRDRIVLDLCMRVVGCADDSRRGAAAGRVGFRPVVGSPCDAALYTRLRQHGWNCAVAWCGHRGGHYGNNRVGFLRAYVLPLLLTR
jgi:pimeloyl-ACP methyl ester carboxylesterase